MIAFLPYDNITSIRISLAQAQSTAVLPIPSIIVPDVAPSALRSPIRVWLWLLVELLSPFLDSRVALECCILMITIFKVGKRECERFVGQEKIHPYIPYRMRIGALECTVLLLFCYLYVYALIPI